MFWNIIRLSQRDPKPQDGDGGWPFLLRSQHPGEKEETTIMHELHDCVHVCVPTKFHASPLSQEELSFYNPEVAPSSIFQMPRVDYRVVILFFFSPLDSLVWSSGCY